MSEFRTGSPVSQLIYRLQREVEHYKEREFALRQELREKDRQLEEVRRENVEPGMMLER